MPIRVTRAAFYGIAFLFWIAIFVLAFEVAERIRSRNDAVSAYAHPIISQAEAEDMEIYDATAPSAHRPAPEIVARYPLLCDLNGASDDKKQELAERWNALILHCDPDGNIEKRFAATKPQTIVELATRAATAANLKDLWPKETSDPSRIEMAFRNLRQTFDLFNGGGYTCAGYKLPVELFLPVESAPNDGFHFLYHPFEAPGASPKMAVVIVPWRWKSFVHDLAPNFYERDSYPHFPRSEVWTNSLGFRDREFVLQKPEGTYRIVCIGGSTTMEGPRNDLTYPKMLEALLREHFKTEAIEVVNCGIDGLTIGGELGKMNEYLAFQPDLIIHYNFVNDAGATMDRAIKRTVLASPVRSALAFSMARSRAIARNARWLWTTSMPSRADYREEAEQYLIPDLRKMNEIAKQAGAKFAVASFACPDIYNLPYLERAWFRGQFFFNQQPRTEFDDYALAAEGFNEACRKFCESESALYIPVAENLKGGIALYVDITHMHIPGMKKKAQIIADNLKSPILESLKNLAQP